MLARLKGKMQFIFPFKRAAFFLSSSSQPWIGHWSSAIGDEPRIGHWSSAIGGQNA
jgi:hypothetical protein